MEIIGIIFIATMIEGLVSYLFGEDGATRPYLKYVALVLGVGSAIAYQIDIPSMIGLATSYGVLNYVISGIIIGRGSNYTNDIITAFRGK